MGKMSELHREQEQRDAELAMAYEEYLQDQRQTEDTGEWRGSSQCWPSAWWWR